MKSDQAVSVKVKTTVRGLDVLSTVYAFAMALGLTQVFLGSQAYLTKLLSGTAPVADEKSILVFFLFANITLLGLRFFWVPRNLQSLVIAAARAHAIAPAADRAKGDLSNASIAFHLVVIFLHGTLFYIICAEFEYVTFALSSNLPLSSSVFLGYVVMHAALLLMNAAWIAIARRQEVRLELHVNNMVAANGPSAGNVWWRNNLVAGLIALAPFSIVGTCRSSATECVQQSIGGPLTIMDTLPTSPQVMATIYYDLVGFLERLDMTSTHFPVYWVLIVFFANSAYDLLNAGRFYVFFEDVEWEDVLESSKDRGPIT
ncbi:MAG: hypothetical protein GC150_04800 [Rhizobiales bacterium]|nr:hypothetical protein [Hyphomicrobiales bacterium]